MDGISADRATITSSDKPNQGLKDVLVRLQRLESIGALISHNKGDALNSLPRVQRADILDEVSDQLTDIRCRVQDLTQ